MPLPKGTAREQYVTALTTVVQRVRDFGAQVLVLSLGTDTLLGDPSPQPSAGMAIRPDDFVEFGRVMATLQLPVLVVQEGGYKMEEAGKAIVQLLRGLSGEA